MTTNLINLIRGTFVAGAMVLGTFSSSVSTAFADPAFPIPRLQGEYFYQNHFKVNQIRRAESVNVSAAGGNARMEALRSQGYSCIHKSPTVRLCSKMWVPTQTPDGLAPTVARAMTPNKVKFTPNSTPPVLTQNGSTTIEWEVRERVQVSDHEVPLYRVVMTNKNQIFVLFQAGLGDYPVSPLLFVNERALVLTLLVNDNDTPTSTTGYMIGAALEKRP